MASHDVTASPETRRQTLTSPSHPSSSNRHIEEISDPKLAKKRLRRSPKATYLILNFGQELIYRTCPLSDVFSAATASATELRHPWDSGNSFECIVGSCDGLICLASVHRPSLLWNPSTGKFKLLPPLDTQPLQAEGSYTIYGLGYDSFSDSYKVVTCFCYKCDGNDGYKNQVKVLTLGTDDSWRRIGDFPIAVPMDEPGIFVSGSLIWPASTASDPWLLISLDLQKESYEEIMQPDYGNESTDLTLGVLRDCLSVISHCDNMYFDVWIMEDFGNKGSWTKLFKVPYIGDHGPFPFVNVLCISEDDELLFVFQSEFIVYHSRNRTFRMVEIQNSKGFQISEAYVYAESSISPFQYPLFLSLLHQFKDFVANLAQYIMN